MSHVDPAPTASLVRARKQTPKSLKENMADTTPHRIGDTDSAYSLADTPSIHRRQGRQIITASASASEEPFNRHSAS